MKFDIFPSGRDFTPGPVFTETVAPYLPPDCTVEYFEFPTDNVIRVITDKGTFIFLKGRLFGVELRPQKQGEKIAPAA